MKSMKYLGALLAVVALAALTLTVGPKLTAATSYTGAGQPYLLFTTASIGALSNTTSSAYCTNVIDVPPGAKDLALELSQVSTAAGGTGVTTVYLWKSLSGSQLDDTTWAPFAPANFTLTASGTTRVSITTNFAVGAYSKIKVDIVTASGNTTQAPLTNTTIRWTAK